MDSLAYTHEETSRNFRPILQASGLPQRAYVDKQSHKGEVRAEIPLRFMFINFDEDAQPVASRLEGQPKNFAPRGGSAEHRL